MAPQASSVVAMPQVRQPEHVPVSFRVTPAGSATAGLGDDQRRPLEVAECCMCGIARPLGLLVPDGGGACADIRWYCKDVKSCTERWTAGVSPRTAHLPREASVTQLRPQSQAGRRRSSEVGVTGAGPADAAGPPWPGGAAWIDGRYGPIEEARISVLDLGVTRSDCTHDVVHVLERRLFRLDAHLDRFAWLGVEPRAVRQKGSNGARPGQCTSEGPSGTGLPPVSAWAAP